MKLTEQQKNCKWCHPGSNIKSRYGLDPWNQGTLRLNEVADEGQATVIDIRYCPMCGRKLGSDN